MKNKLVATILLISTFFIVCLSSIWLHFLLSPVIAKAPGYVFDVPPGASKRHVIADLSTQGIIPHPRLLSIYAYWENDAQVKAGEYFFPQGSTATSIWQQITTGTGLYLHPFTIIPGWTFAELRRALSNAYGFRHVTSKMTDQQIMGQLGVPNLKPEGEFFPETYYYTKGISDLIILKRSFHDMQNKLNAAWSKRLLDLPYKNAYEALIAASLVEKEAHLSSERPIISGVLINRLKNDMLLQFDPTVIYGLGDRYQGKLFKTNLSEDTLYNTYIHKGLPPTPIAMPSLSSIEAALHPTQHDYFYFVAKGDGSHQFSKTLTEHHDAIKVLMKMETK